MTLTPHGCHLLSPILRALFVAAHLNLTATWRWALLPILQEKKQSQLSLLPPVTSW